MHRALFSACAIALSASASQAQPPAPPATVQPMVQFFTALDDLPIPAGLTELGEGFSFETPQGRIVDVIAQGSLSPDAITAFYDSALPALGWGAREADAQASSASIAGYTRGREALTFTIATGPEGSKLRIRLVARPASAALD